MTPNVWTCARLAMVLLVPAWLVATPAEAQRRNPESVDDTPQQAAPRQAAPAPAAVPEPSSTPEASSAPERESGERGKSSDAGGRDRGSKPAVGAAVPRTEPPPSTGDGRPVVVSGGYGGYGGYGYGGYGYGGYYDPYGGYAQYPLYYDEGRLRLKLKPRAAAVYVDGYYVGIVDDYDGIFQRLRIEAGVHRIEIQEPGFEPLIVDVRIDPGRTTTYRGNLKKVP